MFRGQEVIRISRNLKPGPHLRTLTKRDRECADVDDVAVTSVRVWFEPRCRFFSARQWMLIYATGASESVLPCLYGIYTALVLVCRLCAARFPIAHRAFHT